MHLVLRSHCRTHRYRVYHVSVVLVTWVTVTYVHPIAHNHVFMDHVQLLTRVPVILVGQEVSATNVLFLILDVALMLSVLLRITVQSERVNVLSVTVVILMSSARLFVSKDVCLESVRNLIHVIVCRAGPTLLARNALLLIILVVPTALVLRNWI